jgi:hypothetical protein
MNRFIGITVSTLILFAAFSATAQGQEFVKAVHDHNGDPSPGLIDWIWHLDATECYVGGLRFQLNYDPYEIDILGINTAGQFTGHYRFDPPPPQQPTAGTPVPANSVPAVITGTVWATHNLANTSGIQVNSTCPTAIFQLSYQARHTSNVGDAQYNSEEDVVLGGLWPIYHVPHRAVANSIWQMVHNTDTANPVGVSNSYLQHFNNVPGMWLSNSRTYFQGPLVSSVQSAPSPRHVQVTITAQPSQYAHADTAAELVTVYGQVVQLVTPSEFVHLPGTVKVTGTVIQPSSFYLGDPVGGDFTSLGIDHIPEPITALLLSVSGAAVWMRRRSLRKAS